jgi:hypothetical protein
MGEKRRPRRLVRGAYGKISMYFATVSGYDSGERERD